MCVISHTERNEKKKKKNTATLYICGSHSPLADAMQHRPGGSSRAVAGRRSGRRHPSLGGPRAWTQLSF